MIDEVGWLSGNDLVVSLRTDPDDLLVAYLYK